MTPLLLNLVFGTGGWPQPYDTGSMTQGDVNKWAEVQIVLSLPSLLASLSLKKADSAQMIAFFLRADAMLSILYIPHNTVVW